MINQSKSDKATRQGGVGGGVQKTPPSAFLGLIFSLKCVP